jgi:hypothetical protein
VIFLVGLVLLAVGAWGLLRGGSHGAAVLGLGTSIVLGALLVVFAALLPWLGDGPVRIGPLAMTLRIRERRGRPGRRRRSGRRRAGGRRRAAAPRVNGEQ